MSAHNQPAYLHRPGDLPIKELVVMADQTIAAAGGPARCSVHFKYTCMWCGTRCTLNEPNTLYQEGECCACGKTTPITHGGFSIHLKLR